ncbi:MAG: 16S rRNA (guanine(966)-N(2))-methyltransferase RsmD [Gammaproteobacteria bacterium]
MPARSKRARRGPAAAGHRLRIIGGQWRGRRITFADAPGVRPTPDRVRETVFNWLQPVIAGARCLDLFAGSGALGFEALSRGAAQVVMVDADARVAAQLRDQGGMLQAAGLEVLVAEAQQYLAGPAPAGFDIVFLDPPFGRGLLGPCCRSLEAGGWLTAGARIYLEAERSLQALPLPESWTLIRSKQAGQVGYHLAVRQNP